MSRCPQCTTELRKGQFCPNCGLRIPRPSPWKALYIIGLWVLLIGAGAGGTCSVVVAIGTFSDKSGLAILGVIPTVLLLFWIAVGWSTWRKIRGDRL